MDNTLYNALVGPEEASKSISAASLDDVFGACFDIASRHGVTSKVGLYLLHRHQFLRDDEIVVESTFDQKESGVSGFISRPLRNADGVYPASWMMRGGQLTPFEYVDAHLAQHTNQFANKEALTAIGACIESKGMSDYIGIGITSRPALGTKKAGEVLIERDGPVPRSQLVTLETFKGKAEQALPTRWVLETSDRINAPTGWCEPLILCIVYSPGHAIENQGHITDD